VPQKLVTLPNGSQLELPHFFICSYTTLTLNSSDEQAPKTKQGAPYTSKNIRKRRRRYAADNGLSTFDDTGIGTSRNGIQCIAWPSLATLAADTFDCICLDEAVRLKSDDSIQATGVRKMNARHRLICTGTPVKDKIDDTFWLFSYAANGDRDLWPYEGTTAERAGFADQYRCSERNITREEDYEDATGKRKTCKRHTSQVCNTHELYRDLSGLMIRVSKGEVADELVDKEFHIHRVPMSTGQRTAYANHLRLLPTHNSKGEPMNRLSAYGCQLHLLRMAVLTPDAPELQRHHSLPGGSSHALRSSSCWSPKLTKTMELTTDCLSKGEQVIIFSPSHSFSERLYSLLRMAGVTALRLDATVSEAERGRLAEEFKQQRYSVMVAGLKAMGEGASFDKCPNVILPGLDWPYDTIAQAIERVHRLTSRQNVHAHFVLTEGSIDELLYERFIEKSQSASLALDSRIQMGDSDASDINLRAQAERAAALLEHSSQTTITEDTLSQQWHDTLRDSLTTAETTFRARYPDAAAMTSPLDTCEDEDPLVTLCQMKLFNLEGDDFCAAIDQIIAAA
jgi:hypothetical protein